MGLTDARKYINDLHRRQGDPMLWPDYLTGLPDKAAVIEKVTEAYRNLDKSSIHYIRIANIQPYLLKYGSSRHIEIIQWAAAILKTSADINHGFVGTFNTHDFVAITPIDNSEEFRSQVNKQFRKKALGYYSDEDRERGYVLSFLREGKRVQLGFMELIIETIEGETELSEDRILYHLATLCTKQEIPLPAGG